MKKQGDNGVVRIKEIARIANMAMATADRVIHNSPAFQKTRVICFQFESDSNSARAAYVQNKE